MLSLNHPNIVRAYHCITQQLMPAQQQPSPAASPPQLQLAISEGSGEQRLHASTHADSSTGLGRAASVSGAGTPQQPLPPLSLHRQQRTSADAEAFPDRGFAVIHTGQADSRGTLHLHPQQQQTHTAMQSTQAFGEVELSPLRAGSSFLTAGSSLSAGQPSTPPNMPASSAIAPSTDAGTSTGTQLLLRGGITSSSGVGSSFIQDLDVLSSLPAYQHKVNLQQQSLGSIHTAVAQGAPGTTGVDGIPQSQIGQHSPPATSPVQQQQADSPGFIGNFGPGFAVMSVPPPGSISPGTAAAAASAMAILSCSTVSNASTDSLMVPRSMSTLQGSAGPMSLLGSSLVGSRGSLIGTVTGTGTGSAGSLPYLGPTSTSLQRLAGTSWQQQQQPSIAAVMGGSLASIAAGRGSSSSSSQGAPLMSTQSAVQSPAASAAIGVIPHHVHLLGNTAASVEGATRVQGPSAGDSFVVLPAAGSAAASGSGPSVLSSSSVPSGSLGSHAWPLIVSSRAGNDESSSYLTERNTTGSAVGGSSAETWHGQRDPTTLCKTWLVTELCDRWVQELSLAVGDCCNVGY